MLMLPVLSVGSFDVDCSEAIVIGLISIPHTIRHIHASIVKYVWAMHIKYVGVLSLLCR